MNQTLEFFASKGYGVFPYIIIREMSGIYRQVPISFSFPELLKKEGVLVNLTEDESDTAIKEACVETLRKMITTKQVITVNRNSKDNWIFVGNQKREGCVVFDPNYAIYVDSDGKVISKTNNIPSGGTLISMCGETITRNDRHYNFLES